MASVSSSSQPPPLNLFGHSWLCSYTPHYCEENVWKLCESVSKWHPHELSKCWVVFVSNDTRSVPLFCQYESGNSELPLVWDYHVIFLYEPDDRCLVYDLDTKLPFPTYFHKYVTETFRSDRIFNPRHHRYFRVIPASYYFKHFASDRSHMLRPDGTYMKAPPNYPCISSMKTTDNLQSFISMDRTSGPGEVLDLTQFVMRFHKKV